MAAHTHESPVHTGDEPGAHVGAGGRAGGAPTPGGSGWENDGGPAGLVAAGVLVSAGGGSVTVLVAGSGAGSVAVVVAVPGSGVVTA